MPHKIDPDLGFVEFEFPVDPENPKHAGWDGVVVVDVYHASELIHQVKGAYLRELEEAGDQKSANEYEVLRRWASLLFKPTPAGAVNLSRPMLTMVQNAVWAEVSRLEKKGSESSSPDSAGSTDSTASPTA